MDERPKTIPELRGFEKIPDDRVDAYSKYGYAALFGITVEDAEDLIDYHGKQGSHKAIVREIMLKHLRDDEARERAITWDAEKRQRLIDKRQRRAEEERERRRERKRNESQGTANQADEA